MLSKTSSFRLKIEVPEAKEKKSKYLVNIGWCSKMMERSDYRKLGNNNSMLFYNTRGPSEFFFFNFYVILYFLRLVG